MDGYIQINKRNTLKIGIKNVDGQIKKDENGNELYLEFDLEDIELPLKYNKCEFLVRKAKQDLKFDLMIINKHKDVTGKYLLSKNNEDKIKAFNRYYRTMESAMDLFIGKGGVNKIFGETRYYEMYDDLSKMLEPILPKLNNCLKNINEKVKEKYKNVQDDILKSSKEI